MDRRLLENQSNRSIVPRRELQLGIRAAAHGATDGTHAPKMRVTLPKNSIDVSVPCTRHTSDGRRLNFRTVRTGC